jgi:predicted DNA-binding WGR domain protein
MSSFDIPGAQRWTTMERFYVLHVQTNLFGEWELLKAWGGRGSQRGRHQAVPADNREDALRLLAKEARRREKRGYRLVG